jgi:hypothetical protein
MKTGPSIADVQVPGVYEIRAGSGVYYGLEVADHCDASTSKEARASATMRPLTLNTTDVVVPATFAGYTIENVGSGTGTSPHPVDLGVTTHIHRVLGQGTYWAEIEQQAGVYNFTKLINALTAGRARGCKTLWNVAYTPSVYSSDNNKHRSSGQGNSAGWAGAPADLAASMQGNPANNSTVLKNFLNAAIAAGVFALVDYVVWWNEPGYRSYVATGAPFGNWFDTSDDVGLRDLTTWPQSSVTGNQNYTQFVLMQACAYTIIKAAYPAIVFIGCDLYGEQSSQGSGGKMKGEDAFVRWLAAGGATYCDAYGWHSYCDLYQLAGIDGVSLRLARLLQSLDAARATAGAPAKPWYCTEVGYNNLGFLSVPDQKRWAGLNLLIHASLGWKSVIWYAWDSLNAVTAQMSWYLPAATQGLPAGVQAVAEESSLWAQRLAGSTISAGAVMVGGRWCGRIDGVPYVF